MKITNIIHCEWLMWSTLYVLQQYVSQALTQNLGRNMLIYIQLLDKQKITDVLKITQFQFSILKRNHISYQIAVNTAISSWAFNLIIPSTYQSWSSKHRDNFSLAYSSSIHTWLAELEYCKGWNFCTEN